MTYLNISIPEFYCLARKEFFYNLESHVGEYEEVIAENVAENIYDRHIKPVFMPFRAVNSREQNHNM